MNYKMVGFVLGRIFLIEAALMLFPMGCAAIYGEWASIPAFLIPVLILPPSSPLENVPEDELGMKLQAHNPSLHQKSRPLRLGDCP